MCLMFAIAGIGARAFKFFWALCLFPLLTLAFPKSQRASYSSFWGNPLSHCGPGGGKVCGKGVFSNHD